MNTSLQPEIRKESLKQILAAYFKKLSATVELLTKSPFPHTFEEMVEDYKQKSLLGFWMNIFVTMIMEVVATIDPSKIEGDFMTAFQNAIAKWIQENPERAKEKAIQLVDVCDEYEKLMAE
jgi:hypothetical protein